MALREKLYCLAVATRKRHQMAGITICEETEWPLHFSSGKDECTTAADIGCKESVGAFQGLQIVASIRVTAYL